MSYATNLGEVVVGTETEEVAARTPFLKEFKRADERESMKKSQDPDKCSENETVCSPETNALPGNLSQLFSRLKDQLMSVPDRVHSVEIKEHVII